MKHLVCRVLGKPNFTDAIDMKIRDGGVRKSQKGVEKRGVGNHQMVTKNSRIIPTCYTLCSVSLRNAHYGCLPTQH
jgi:hypothetical protein